MTSNNLHFFNDEIEIIPASVREEARVEWESYHSDVGFRVFKSEELCLSMSKLDDACDGDEDEGEHFGISEVILDLEQT